MSSQTRPSTISIEPHRLHGDEDQPAATDPDEAVADESGRLLGHRQDLAAARGRGPHEHAHDPVGGRDGLDGHARPVRELRRADPPALDLAVPDDRAGQLAQAAARRAERRACDVVGHHDAAAGVEDGEPSLEALELPVGGDEVAVGLDGALAQPLFDAGDGALEPADCRRRAADGSRRRCRSRRPGAR